MGSGTILRDVQGGQGGGGTRTMPQAGESARQVTDMLYSSMNSSMMPPVFCFVPWWLRSRSPGDIVGASPGFQYINRLGRGLVRSVVGSAGQSFGLTG